MIKDMLMMCMITSCLRGFIVIVWEMVDTLRSQFVKLCGDGRAVLREVFALCEIFTDKIFSHTEPKLCD